MDTAAPKDDGWSRQGHSGGLGASAQDAPIVKAGGAGSYGAISDSPNTPSGSPGCSPPTCERDPLRGDAFRQQPQYGPDEHVECHCYRGRTRWQRFWDLILDWIQVKLAPRPPSPPLKWEEIIFYLWVAAVTFLFCILPIFRWGWNELSYVCRVDDGNVSQLSLSFHPDHYKDFFFHLDRDIRGDVFVGQSYNPSSPNITIHVTARASSSDVLEVLALGSWPTPELSMMDASVYINTPSETSRKEILSKGCTFVRVEILFPANMTSYESLRIRHQERGDVRVRMGGVNLETTTEAAVVAGPSVGMTVDQLDIAVYDGWVTVRDVVVSDELKVVSKLGGIKAQADVNRRVTMEAATDLTLELGSSSSVLDVKVTSRKLARVIMKTPYVGHVEMMTTTSNGSMPVVFVPRSKFVEQKSTAQTLIGYIPDSNNEEPMYLPRIEISGSAPIVELLA